MTQTFYFSNSLYPAMESPLSDVLCLEDFSQEAFKDGRLFFVDATDQGYAMQACRALRSEPLASVYLKPIILTGVNGGVNQPLLLAADHTLPETVISPSILETVRISVAPMLQRIGRLPDKDWSSDTHVAFKILRHLFVRNMDLKPVRTAQMRSGFIYPQISCYPGAGDQGLWGILDTMKSQGLLSSYFFDKSYFCSRCGCAFLSFREVCSHCGSVNLFQEDLIHHFRCAYVGPQAEYRHGAKLSCPKCDKDLKHIGVDYDKPSTVYRCNDCGNTCQDADILSWCYHCGKQSLPEEMNQRVIHGYTLTALGENAALYGMDSLFRDLLSEKIHVLPLDYFKRFVDNEGQRIKRYGKSVSSLIYFHIKGLDQVCLELGDRALSIFNELSTIVTSILRQSDVTTALNNSLFLSILVETPMERAFSAISRLTSSASGLLNGHLNVSVDIKAYAFPVTGEVGVDTLIDEVMEHVNT
ncbi:MAG: hypothetical protein JXB25_05965 [Deltaproteobacteria bacterium]|nr:hypothetical protein [Deltaproteobacteria bacterium]